MNRETRERVVACARSTGGVLSRTALRRLGVGHDHIRHEVDGGRWELLGTQTVLPYRGEPSLEGRRWRAVWETGAGIAVLDGVTALQVAGLEGFVDDEVHLSVVHRHDASSSAGIRVHKVIRRVPEEVVEVGIPRTAPAVAALRAAYWAVSDRQAALVLLMAVQQRLTTPEELARRSEQLRGRRRRGFVKALLADVSDGVRSLGELDFALLCRQHRLPEPSRQVVVHGPRGRIYLDVRWDEQGLVVEVDGAQHREGLQVSADNLSRNEVTLGDDRLLRIDLVGLRLHPGAFMAQVRRALSRHPSSAPGRGIRSLPRAS